MTSPVTTAASPATRPAAGADGGDAASAEPFATALDGAMTAGRPAADGTGPDGGQDGSGDEEAADEGVPATAADVVPTAADGVVAVLWARLTGSVAHEGTVPGGKPEDAAAPGRPAVTGLAHARAMASDVAHGLRGTQPGQAAGAPATPVPAAPPAAAPTAPAPGAVPTPAPTAAGDAAAALAAAGVEIVVAPPDAARTTGTAAPAQPAGSAPVTSPAPVPGAVPPAAGTLTGGDTGSDAQPDGGAPDGAPGPASGVTGPTGAPATTGTAPPPRADTAPPATPAQVAGQLARPVAVLRGGADGTHTMTVVLTPETLGPVEISVTVSQGTVELTLRGAHDHGRAALVDALPDLRRDLEAAGLTCSRVDVDRGNRDGAFSSSAQQQAAGRDAGGGRQHERGDGARPWHRPADNGEGRPAPTRTASGLDVRV